MNYYPRNIGDWRVATFNLTRVQRDIYSGLIDTYYDKELPLTADFDMLAEDQGCRTVEERESLRYVLRRFFVATGAEFRHERCDEEIARFHHVVEVARKAGRASAERRGAARAERKLNGGSTPVERAVNELAATVQPPKTEDRRTNPLQPAVEGVGEQAKPTAEPSASLPPPTAEPATAEPAKAPKAAPAPTPLTPSEKSPQGASRPSRKAPKDFGVSPEMAAWAATECPLLSVRCIDAETRKFKDHTFGRAISDWVGAWRNWLRKEQQYREQRRVPAPVAAKAAQRDKFMAAVKGDRNGDIARQHHGREGALDVESRVVREDEEQPPEPRD